MSFRTSEAAIGRKYCKPEMTLEERLTHIGWTVTESGCHEWSGGRKAAGYAVLNVHHRQLYVHRIALEIKLGRKLGPAMEACHHCDNPPCMNADHLFEGSAADNHADAIRKGRQHAPTFNQGLRQSRYTKSQFDQLYAMQAIGESGAAISRATGISLSTAYQLLAGTRTRPRIYKPEETE